MDDHKSYAMTAPAGAAMTEQPPRGPFAALGRFTIRFRYLIVVAWLVATGLAVLLLPSLASISNGNNSSFLPASSPSVQAVKLAGPFQQGSLPTATLVASAAHPLTAADQAAVDRAEAAMRRVPNVVQVRDQGLSGDGTTRKAAVTLSAQSSGNTQQKTVVDALRATFGTAGAPAGLSFYLTGQTATSMDNQSATSSNVALTQLLSLVFILGMLLVIYRSVLAPFVTLLPAALVVVLAGPVIAEAQKLGVQVSSVVQFLLIILVLGAGTDYGLFLIFRVREEMQRGLDPHAALVKSLSRVGETITFSGGIVIAALLCLLLATLGIYQGMGPSLAIAIALMLLAGLTLTPALLAIFGRRVFWPSTIRPSAPRLGAWGRIVQLALRRPLATLMLGLALFGGLAVAVAQYSAAGFSSNGATSTTSQSARGTAVLDAHFPAAQANPTNLLLRYPFSVWQRPAVLAQVDQALRADHVFQAISGPLNPNGTPLSPAQLAQLHAVLGPAINLPRVAPAGVTVPAPLYNAYRATAQFISADGHTVQFYATLTAGDPAGTAAMQAVPAIRQALAQTATASGATASGVAGQAASFSDIAAASNNDIAHLVPVVLLVIALLLALVLRSAIAPWYLIASVGLSYLAALGLAVIVFMGIQGNSGLNFVIPFFMFIFLMALGSDYNVLVMTRIREEAQHAPLREAVVRAINVTGGTVTSAGLILAGSFAVLTITGGGQIQQIGLGVAAGILMDTFLIRTLLIPSLVVLLGRWNWWPSPLSRQAQQPASTAAVRAREVSAVREVA
ncbi:MAG TPA: MMPL family transporter [Chloroflexota bacterium]|nr:MMPL family transporter [Chloroflexota bacterium]